MIQKKFFKYIKRIFIIIVLVLLSSNVFAFENRIIVKIDNKIITKIDIKNEVKYLSTLNPSLKNLSKNELFEIAKTSLIRETIKEIEISKMDNVVINQDYLENIISNIYQNIGFKNKDEFLNYLKSQNIDIKDIKKKISKEALWNQLILNKYKKKVKINENKIKNEIETNKQFVNSYLLYEIIFNAETKDELKAIYEKIKKSINKNGFENTASIFSISDSAKVGGKLGWINESSINKKIVKQIDVLDNNEYTNPIQVPGGFLILNVKEKKTMEQKTDIEAEFLLKVKASTNQQLNQYSNIYFNKIKKNIKIYEK
ncbi:peptidylprolyl isomerase [Candidatus Pelagibacter sp.]|uniref:peptidylprolyl isomerase n=1 Tax=Candidatus Pelagibacter sp. TaxID=2024849 RepID=UPI003F87636F